MSELDISLIVVTHNSARWLAGFFQSWNVTASSIPHEILIIDSGSTDNTRELSAQLAPTAKIIACDNIGYGAAANRGVAQCNTRFFLLCNADLTFSQHFLPTLLAGAGVAQGFVCVVPQLLNPDGSVQPSVGRFPSIGGIILDQLRRPVNRKYLFPQPHRTSQIDWASGTCLLFRRDAFLSVNGFDEQFFLYTEEVDLQYRMKAAGHTIWFIPTAKLTHHAPNALLKPRQHIQRYAARGLLRYFAKHGTTLQLLAYRFLAFLSLRLSPREAFASRQKILNRPTGP